MKPDHPLPEDLRRALALRLALTRAGLVAERITRCFWPVWTILLASLAALAFGFQDWAPVELFWLALLAVPTGLALALVRGIRLFRWPSGDEAMQRLDERLPGRPLATLTDRQALGDTDPQSRSLWQAHLARMRERAGTARPVPPDLRISGRDRLALRYAALTAFVLALLFGSLARIGDVTLPGHARAPVAAASWEGWAEPPAYTGKPGVYLSSLAPGALSLPEGTKITLRLYGPEGAIAVEESLSGNGAPAARGDRQEFLARQSGQLSISGANDRTWSVTVVPDAPPHIALAGPMGRKADGTMQQPFRATDDYGIAHGQVTFTLDLAAVDRRYGLAPAPDPQPPLTFDLPRPPRGGRGDGAALLAEDASQHPWANLPVRMVLSVTDARGQSAQTEARSVILPGRRFFDPLAAAIIEMRRDLLWSGANDRRSLQILRAVSHRPEGLFAESGTYLMLRAAIRQLDAATAGGQAASADARKEIAAALWTVALRIEDGSTEDARARMKRAQERLSEAIRNGADPAEIRRLMDDLRQATNDYMRNLARNGKPDPADRFARNQHLKNLSASQLQDMMDEIQRLMDEGKMDEAQRRLEQLSQLMDNLKVTQGGQGDAQDGAGGQAMRDLRETLNGQQSLSDDTFRQQQQQFGQGRSLGQPNDQTDGGQTMGDLPGQPDARKGGPGQGKPGGSGQGTGEDGSDLAGRQQALRDQLDSQRQRLSDLPGPDGDAARSALDEAGRAMDQAEKALRDGDLPGAIDRQAQAIEQLRQGMRRMNDALARTEQDNPTDQGQTAIDPQNAQARDPLGRSEGNSFEGDGHALVDGPDVYRRARDLLDEIRRRASEQDRPAAERDYLDRLTSPD
ncbi:MAG: DUF4175 domain-containing protein [Proteobacteria bacterium]|nr:DUF4175 domain-containing protein [Pseudomonadota bacterium]